MSKIQSLKLSMYFILQASLKGFLISAAFTQYYFLFVGLLHLLFSHLREIPRVNVTVPQETFHAINHQGARCREGHTITTPAVKSQDLYRCNFKDCTHNCNQKACQPYCAVELYEEQTVKGEGSQIPPILQPSQLNTQDPVTSTDHTSWATGRIRNAAFEKLPASKPENINAE